MPEANELTALSYKVDPIGKLFSDSKTRHTWTMEIDGETVVLVVTASWNSNKFVVELNGYERFHQTVSGLFTYSIKFRDRFFKLQQLGESFSLTIDTIPFAQFSARAKAAQAALLKSYASRPVSESGPGTRTPGYSSVSESEIRISKEPFSGDLAKRLGKHGKPKGYVNQEDLDDQKEEEDFFSVPVDIKSYVTDSSKDVSNLTVIPNLIELSSAPPSAVPSVAPIIHEEEKDPTLSKAEDTRGPVTPRDQISPSKLENPFAAFDELEGSSSTRGNNPFSSI